MTLILILKSVLPFLKEMLLKDKTLKAILFGNLLATALVVSLIFVFIMILYVSNAASRHIETIAILKAENERITARLIIRNDENLGLSKQVGELEEKLKQFTPVLPESPVQPLIIHPPRTPAPKPKVTPKPKPTKSQTQTRLDELE